MKKKLKAKEVNIYSENEIIKSCYPLEKKFKDKKTQHYYDFFSKMLKPDIKKKQVVLLLKNIATYGKNYLDKGFMDSFALNPSYVNKLLKNDFLKDIEPVNYDY